MKQNEWNEGLNNLDSDIIENYVMQKEAYSKKRKKPLVWTKYIAVAACMCLVVCGIIFVPMMFKSEGREDESNKEASTLPIPVWNDAQYSASDIGKMLDNLKLESIATNSYTKVCVGDDKYLYIDPIPEDEYLGIYKYKEFGDNLSKQELIAFADKYTEKVKEYLDFEFEEYRFDDHYANRYGYINLESFPFNLEYMIDVDQYSEKTVFEIYSSYEYGRKILLSGEKVSINTNQSDEEILASIESIKNKLFDMFNVRFSDAKVKRSYYEYDELPSISVYYYNQSDNELNETLDYITISFGKNGTAYSIRFNKARDGENSKFELQAKAKRISIEEAEDLLYNGYVFGGHSCPLCMAMQEKITFDNYNYVDIEYVDMYNEDGEPFMVIPFYAFYKNIGMSKYGYTIYAKTYVCAIELTGYEEYFESQREEHSSSNMEYGTIGVPEEYVTEEYTTEETITEDPTEEIITNEISKEEMISQDTDTKE